jgi:predicted DNA-binding ribbon-helix-helix protein
MTIRKYSLSIRGHRTSISLEEPFYQSLAEIARGEGKAVATLIAEIDAARRDETPARTAAGSADVYSGLSSAIRLYVLDHFKRKCAALEAARSNAAK